MSTAFKRGRSPNTVLSPGASSVSGSVVSNNRVKSINRVANKKPRRAAAVRKGPFNNSANERSEGMGNSEEMSINNRRGVRTAATGAAAAIERNLQEKRLKNLISLRNKLPNVLKAKYTNDALRRMSTRELSLIHI